MDKKHDPKRQADIMRGAAQIVECLSAYPEDERLDVLVFAVKGAFSMEFTRRKVKEAESRAAAKPFIEFFGSLDDLLKGNGGRPARS